MNVIEEKVFVKGKTGGMENGEWRMENGEWRMENGEWRMENGEFKAKREKMQAIVDLSSDDV
jgi:hypothetical protein